jgi:thioredoxin 1
VARAVHNGYLMLNKTEKLDVQNGALSEITSEDFVAEVLSSKQPVLVEFWTPWSRPCQVLDSVLQKFATDCEGKIKVVKVNADDCLDLSLVYDIQSVPTLIFFVEGNLSWRIVGTATSDAIKAKLNGFLE